MPISEFDSLTPRQVDYVITEHYNAQVTLDARSARICQVLAQVNGNKYSKLTDFMTFIPKSATTTDPRDIGGMMMSAFGDYLPTSGDKQ